MDSEELESRVRRITASLEDSKENPIVGGYMPPYIGSEEIKFVIIGQDPTVRNPKSREKIVCTLNLDKNGQLRSFVERICNGLSVTMDNLYATNLFKYFYNSHLEHYLEYVRDIGPLAVDRRDKYIDIRDGDTIEMQISDDEV